MQGFQLCNDQDRENVWPAEADKEADLEVTIKLKGWLRRKSNDQGAMTKHNNGMDGGALSGGN